MLDSCSITSTATTEAPCCGACKLRLPTCVWALSWTGVCEGWAGVLRALAHVLLGVFSATAGKPAAGCPPGKPEWEGCCPVVQAQQTHATHVGSLGSRGHVQSQVKVLCGSNHTPP